MESECGVYIRRIMLWLGLGLLNMGMLGCRLVDPSWQYQLYQTSGDETEPASVSIIACNGRGDSTGDYRFPFVVTFRDSGGVLWEVAMLDPDPRGWFVRKKARGEPPVGVPLALTRETVGMSVPYQWSIGSPP